MKLIENMLKLTPDQLLFATLKFLGYDIFACGEHEEDNPHRWPGNSKICELASKTTIVTVGLTGGISMEGPNGAYPMTLSMLIGSHLKQMVGWGGRFNITSGKHGDFMVQTTLQLNADEEVDCTIHGTDLNNAICFAFVQARSKGVLMVPDALVE